jgi:hypothetical protein
MSIAAMKQALDALENPWVAGAEGVANAIIALRAAIAEAAMQRLTDVQQEMEPTAEKSSEVQPVAWMVLNSLGDDEDITYYEPSGGLLPGWSYKPLYTHPTRCKWIGLTNEEIDFIAEKHKSTLVGKQYFAWYDYALAIETKLKEKNS